MSLIFLRFPKTSGDRGLMKLSRILGASPITIDTNGLSSVIVDTDGLPSLAIVDAELRSFSPLSPFGVVCGMKLGAMLARCVRDGWKLYTLWLLCGATAGVGLVGLHSKFLVSSCSFILSTPWSSISLPKRMYCGRLAPSNLT